MGIVVVGGSGFIGTCLATLLTCDCIDFKIVDKEVSKAFPKQTILGDVRSLDDLSKMDLENSVLINLAAEHRDDVKPLSLYDDVNVGGAKNLCIVARQKNINKIIFTSSVAVYGFAPLGTDETGAINPFNEYGRTKYAAELIFKEWQLEDPLIRTLVIIRPTVVFGERNRGNVYNLLKQISSGRFVMIGTGENRKSMAYVENIASFLKYATTMFQPGVHTYNYIDKPDFTMNKLLETVNPILGKSGMTKFRLPYWLGITIGKCFDLLAWITGKRLAISSIRVKKFCANSMYNTHVSETGFVPPVPFDEALKRTLKYEFLEEHSKESVFYSE